MSFIADRVRTDSNFANLREIAYALISRLDTAAPSDQIKAMFLASVIMAETVGLDPFEEVVRAKRIIPYADGEYTYHLKALRDYAANELNRVQT